MNDDEFRIVIEKNRYRSPAQIHFLPSVDKLIDVQHCVAISRWLKDTGAKWERCIATPNLGDTLPSVRGVYMFVWCPRLTLEFHNDNTKFHSRWVMYVGKAGIEDGKHDTIKDRYVSEYSRYVGGNAECLWARGSAKDRDAILQRHLAVRPLEYWYLAINDPDSVMLIEDHLLKILSPPANQQHTNKLRPVSVEPA